MSSDSELASRWPPAAWRGIGFSGFNAFSWSVALGSPMILYFKHLGASATMLGFVAALAPLLTLLQIPASTAVERVGYRRFMLRGWTIRTLFLFGMIFVPLIPDAVPPATRMAMMLALLFLFNASRGIAMCAWLPWLTQWIPEGVRGRYLSSEHIVISLTTLLAIALSSLALGYTESESRYAFVFGLSFLGATASLLFLRAIPDVPAPEEARSRRSPPWREMVSYAPFRQLLIYNLIHTAAIAGAGVFWIPLLRDHFHKSDSFILMLVVIMSGLAALCMAAAMRIVDKVGSRPLLAVSGTFMILHFGLWGAAGAGAMPLNLATAFLIQACAAVGHALLHMPTTRLLLATVPALGRSHFLAIFTSTNALVGGFTPVAWGLLLDGLAGWRRQTGFWTWNNYSLLYGLLILLIALGLFQRRRIAEPRAMKTDEFLKELFIRTPARALARFAPRDNTP